MCDRGDHDLVDAPTIITQRELYREREQKSKMEGGGGGPHMKEEGL